MLRNKTYFAPDGLESSSPAGSGEPAPSGSSAVQSPAPAPAPSSDKGGSSFLSEDVERLFRYDPFDKPLKEPGDGQSEPPVEKPPAPVAAPQAAPTPPAKSPELERLELQLAELRGQLAAQAAPPPQREQDTLQRQRAERLQRYSYRMPAEIQSAFLGDDPNMRLQALGAVLAAHGAHIEEQVTTMLRQEFGQMVPQVVEQRNQHQAFVQRVNTEFYTAHPDLNDPALRPFVAQTAAQLFQERGGRVRWDADTMKEVADRVKATLGRFTNRQPAPPPRLIPQNTRALGVGNGAPRDPNSPDAVAATLFG